MRQLPLALDTKRHARTRSALQFAAATMAVWTLLALLSVAQTAVYLRDRAQEVPWDKLIVTRFVDWYTCALFLPILFWLARRWPLERANLVRTIPLHLAASVLCVLAKYAVYLPLARRLYRPSLTYRTLLASDALSELVIFWAVIGIIHAVEFYRRYQDGRLVATQLEAELANARLEVLAAQLRPHFLFNTIGAVSELMHHDTVAADRMLNGLAELLRQSLNQRASHDVSLGEELALLTQYIDIMRIRFGPRLTVRVDVPPPLLETMVPAFLLQPLVENAFEHGVAHRGGPAVVLVSADHIPGEPPQLRLRVIDDGPGLSRPTPADGIGLENTRRRLERRYGDDAGLLLQELPDGRTEARITLPYLHGSLSVMSS